MHQVRWSTGGGVAALNLLTCLQVCHHQGELGLVLLLCHVVEGAAQVLLGLCQLVGQDLQSWPLPDHAAAIAALGDPHVAVGRVGVGATLEEDQFTRVDGEDLACPQALARVDLQVVGSVCEGERHTLCFCCWKAQLLAQLWGKDLVFCVFQSFANICCART